MLRASAWATDGGGEGAGGGMAVSGGDGSASST